MKRRVVVTGMGALSPLGNDWPSVRAKLQANITGVHVTSEWEAYEGVRTRLASTVREFSLPDRYPRKKTRAMGRVAQLSTVATECALVDAGLLDSPALHDGSTGISYGTTAGSPPAMEVYARRVMEKKSLKSVSPNDYIQFMSHTAAANLGQFFEVRGRIIPTCSACTSSSQGIGYAYESIKHGLVQCMIAGGAEEMHVINVAVFEVLFATSITNGEPICTPRPFDRKRDGLVVAEGAGTLILEELEHARARRAPIHAEVLGFATNCDGDHMTQPNAEGMERVMRAALADAALTPDAIDFVNAHATGTEVGDIAESLATARVFGRRIPVTSLKGHMGHTLGACGALEAWISIQMMREGWVAPTLNLTEVDPRCGDLDYVMGECRPLEQRIVMTNNFAFGGINTSLILRRWE
ncbi:MAG: beta-ketoacyl-ACP synthase [Planctomycetes bacterium]|nr:beta-ketoacyl-ACP synthase [Planctomycetota bacterium]